MSACDPQVALDVGLDAALEKKVWSPVLVAALLAACSAKQGEAPEGPAPASAPNVEWKLVTTWPKNLPALGTAPEKLAELVAAMSAGRFQIKVYAAGELVPALEVFDAVSQGNAEMGHGAAYYWRGKVPMAAFFTTVPFGMTAQEMNGWLRYGGGLELWRELYAPFGLVPLPAGNSGVQMAGWFNKEINSLADLQGLKMRIPGLGAEVVNRLGATAVNLPGGEIMPALQSGVIDATEWVGPWNDLAFGFHKVAKFYYGPGFHEPSSALETIVGKEKFEALPSGMQAAVENACMAENGYMLSEFTAANGAAQTVLTERHGVRIGSFPDDVMRAAFAVAEDVLAETAAEGELARRIYDSWTAFRREALARGPYAEQGYMNKRALGG